MQMTISVKIGEEEVISKPFDFEAMCLIDDARYGGEKSGPLNFCREVVPYLFDGTKATEKELKNLPPDVMAGLCNKVWSIYVEVMKKATKNG